MDETTKSPREWEKETGIEVLDADGWRGRTGRDYSEPISEEEFRYRASFSTVRSTKPIWKESPEEALDLRMNEEIPLPKDDDDQDDEVEE